MEYLIAYILGVAACLALTYGYSHYNIKKGGRTRHNQLGMILLSALSWTGVGIFLVLLILFRFLFPKK